MIALPEPLSDGVVTLRPWREADVDELVACLRDPGISRWTGIPWPYEEQDARVFISGGEQRRRGGESVDLAITAADGGRLLGGCGLPLVVLPHSRAEIGYWLAPEARGRGAATRAVRLLADWAFGVLGLARLEILVDPANTASLAVAERTGFEREGMRRSYLADGDGGRRDVIAFVQIGS